MVSATVTPQPAPSNAELDERLRRLEESVAELTRAATVPSSRQPKKDPNWYINGAGRFADSAAFEEIVRLGRAYRESLRPKAGKTRGGMPTSNRRSSKTAARKGSRART
jgi:hypothetical protein